MSSGRRVLVVLYTASGAAALVYEVVWTRLFSLHLGHTVAAASTVLAAFMGGLAIGAWAILLVLSLSKDERTLLRMYAGLELAVAAVALLLPFALRATVPALAWAYADGTAPARFAFARVAISLALLGVPAAAMGATFPVAATWFSGAAADAGLLYAANTAGAAAGAIAAGFWLVPAIGLRGTTWVGVALNVIAAAGAVWLSTAHARPAEPAEPQVSSRRRRAKSSPRVPRATAPELAWIAVGISGFAALVYEVAWTRLLALIIGPTTYAFATMAAAFVGGLAIGSAIGTRVARRAGRLDRWLGAMLIFSGVSAAAAATFAATRLPLLVAAQVADPSVVFTRVVLGQAINVALLLLPMTVALGATFPIALALAASGAENVGRDTARVYAANTVGAIAGALAAGFALIPALGLRWTFDAAALVAIVTGGACLFAGLRSTELGARVIALGAAAAAVAAILLLPSWDRTLLSSGAYKYAPYLAGADLDAVLRAGDLEYYREGAAGTVSVRRMTGTRALAIDGKVDASDGADMLTQRLLGLLPVVLHGHARDVCVIGLGSGVTSASALAPGTVQREDVVEISPEVVEASRMFARENGNVLENPAVRLIVGDGRSHLLLTPRQYDVVVSEPSNPWMAGVAALFTREFFLAARARLKPNGLLCQWAHTYDISENDLRSIVRTFASVFPQGTLWLVGEGDLLLIGARDGAVEARLDGSADSCRRGGTAAMLTTLGAGADTTAFDLLSLYAGGPAELARFADAAPLNDDDGTRLEYSAPRGIYGRSAGENAAAIRALRPVLPVSVRAVLEGGNDTAWQSRGAVLLKAEAYGLAFDAFRHALAMNSRNVAALSGFSQAAAGARQEAEARAWLQSIASREPDNAAVRVELSHLLAATGDMPAALKMAGDALHLAPQDPRVAEQVASVLADANDADRLAPLADALAARFPDRPDGAYYRAAVMYLRGKTEDTVSTLRHVVDAHPDHARAQNLLGAACATLGRSDCARAAFEASIQASPHDPSGYVNLGVFCLQSGDPRTALDAFGQALALDPRSTAARNGLSQVRAALDGNPQ